MSLKEKANKLKTDIPAIFLALKDKETPIVAKIFAGITVAYALSPIDLIPDFIPVLGYLDDVILLPFFVALTVRLIPKDVLDRNRKHAVDLWKDGKPKRWYFAIPIVLIWAAVLALLCSMVCSAVHQTDQTGENQEKMSISIKDGKTIRTGTEYDTYQLEPGEKGIVSIAIDKESGCIDVDVYLAGSDRKADYTGRDLDTAAFDVILQEPGDIDTMRRKENEMRGSR